jgi:hypothetical protein
MQPLSKIPAYRIVRWGKDDHGGAGAHHPRYFSEDLAGFDNMLDHIGAKDNIDRR